MGAKITIPVLVSILLLVPMTSQNVFAADETLPITTYPFFGNHLCSYTTIFNNEITIEPGDTMTWVYQQNANSLSSVGLFSTDLFSVVVDEENPFSYTFDQEGSTDVFCSSTAGSYRLTVNVVPPPVDNDGDGHFSDVDCNDSDPDVGLPTVWFFDGDSDSHGKPNTEQLACTQPENYVNNRSDCNDFNSGINPGATEIANDGIDQDCDGLDLIIEDEDNDGFSISAGDCNDLDSSIFPGANETPYDGIDQDCDGFADEGLSVGLLEQIDELLAQIASFPQNIIASLISEVETLVDDDSLDAKDAKKSLKKLDNALDKLEKGNEKACKDVSKFVKSVEKLVNKGKLDAATAQPLLDEAESLLVQCTMDSD